MHTAGEIKHVLVRKEEKNRAHIFMKKKDTIFKMEEKASRQTQQRRKRIGMERSMILKKWRELNFSGNNFSKQRKPLKTAHKK